MGKLRYYRQAIIKTYCKRNKSCVFPLLRSFDFVNWDFAGNALIRPDATLGDNYWDPEVAYCDRQFYLYYSVGHEDKNHQLRVATNFD